MPVRGHNEKLFSLKTQVITIMKNYKALLLALKIKFLFVIMVEII